MHAGHAASKSCVPDSKTACTGHAGTLYFQACSYVFFSSIEYNSASGCPSLCPWLICILVSDSFPFFPPFFPFFWAAAPKGTMSCRTQGESLRPSVRPSPPQPHPQGFVSFGAQIRAKWPKSKQNGPNPGKMG